MTEAGPGIAPPGWYVDPSGTGRRRWWNGIAWTNHMEGDRVAQAYVPGAVEQPVLSSSTSVNPWPVWALVLLPLVALAQFLTIDFGAFLRDAIVAAETDGLLVPPPGLLVAQLVGWVSYIGTVVLAYLDWRALRRRGVVRPFHWAFAFLPQLVYLIGRAVVLRRRVGRGQSPVWIFLLVSTVSTFVVVLQVMQSFMGVAAELAQQLPQP